ncbi:DUF6090 family protein [Croceitalea vernalis]|uniref:DUF6090 family protein n=1 Tax=Croceitalea vernalis TaxID=3075599 RepID=A0ABU3BF05_9FLAO|nr:DUF6090 family protein [Croceitalea sp. P007]MDT0620742.1 DUF6090 family protein [Croceitalea sp. P007]
MIKFFRQIRQKLLSENKFSKYLLYAIGEIVLVVIGILIALQINIWKEYRKDREKEKIILNDLAENIKINIKTFQNDLDSLHEWNLSSEIVIQSITNELPYSNTLKQHFHSARITKQNLLPSKAGYEGYKDQGLDIITNKVLSSEIIKLYEVTIPGHLSTLDIVNQFYPPFDNHIVQNFNYLKGEGLTPHDYTSLFSDHFYISWIKAYAQGRLDLIEVDKKLIKECESVLKLIENELN